MRKRDLQVLITFAELLREELIQGQERGDILDIPAVVGWIEEITDALKAKLKDNG